MMADHLRLRLKAAVDRARWLTILTCETCGDAFVEFGDLHERSATNAHLRATGHRGYRVTHHEWVAASEEDHQFLEAYGELQRRLFQRLFPETTDQA